MTKKRKTLQIVLKEVLKHATVRDVTDDDPNNQLEANENGFLYVELGMRRYSLVFNSKHNLGINSINQWSNRADNLIWVGYQFLIDEGIIKLNHHEQ